MFTQTTQFNLINNTQFPFTTTISHADGSDWADNNQPKNNLNNLLVGAFTSTQKQEDINTLNSSAWFDLQLTFGQPTFNGSTVPPPISMRVNQFDARNDARRQLRVTSTSNPPPFRALESCSSAVNNLMIVPAFDASNWMANVPDATLLSALNIPGTHDSFALYGGSTTETQTMSLTNQLNAGIRFLDIRPRLSSDKLPIYHGDNPLGVNQNIDFTQVVASCAAFLQSHPKECIVMSVKEEGGPDGNNQLTFDRAIANCIQNSRQHFYTTNAIPALGGVRGQIVLIRRYQTTPSQPLNTALGIDASSWSDEASISVPGFGTNVKPGTLLVQDLYQDYGDTKWDDVFDLLEQSLGDTNTSNWYLNFMSYSYLLRAAFPDNNAQDINPKMVNYLVSKLLTKPRVGTIVMDFPEYPAEGLLIQLIILCNSLSGINVAPH